MPFRFAGYVRRSASLAGACLGCALLAVPAAPMVHAGQEVREEGPYPGSPGSFAGLAEGLIGAVVNISTSQTIQGGEGPPRPQVPPGSPFEEFFEDFFDQQQGEQTPRERTVSSLGSGFVVDSDGIIVTNNHVIADADEIVANFADGTSLPAEVIGHDSQTDVAVLRVEPEAPLEAVSFGDSDALRVGDWVLAIGNPFGLGGSVTAGIVSAQQRDINTGPYDAFIQTDASINRGNSGGPLFNLDGDVVGINTAIISPSGGSIGIGFAIPASIAENVIGQLIEHGETRRGWLGARIQDVTEDIAESLGLDKAHGALIAGVTEDGPAGAAGLQTGDVIVSFDGQEVPEMRDLPRIVADTEVGKTVVVELVRRGATTTVEVEVGRLEGPEDQVAAPGGEEITPPEPETVTALGFELAELTELMRERYGLADSVETGAVITAFAPDAPATDNQIREGEVIVEIAQETVTSPDDVVGRVAELREDGRDSALVLVASPGGEMRFVVVPIPEGE